VASTCFCGCGRKVRFGRKTLSLHGETANRTVDVLRTVSLRLVASDPDATAKITVLIEHGEQIRDLYAGLIHGTHRAPSADLQQRILEWQRVAPALAAEHARIVAEMTTIQRAELANPAFAKAQRALDAIFQAKQAGDRSPERSIAPSAM
jgi:hypothetical protein